MRHYKPCKRNQLYLLPPSIDEWLPENQLARYIIEVIDQLDMTRLTRHYSGKGSQAYHPA
ncbi:MAG: IS5/IS1182 family transposase, partial [Nitrosomonas sp.]|nr:IS5/IS1182 family transposase [Nitrosomonas sp.]